MKKQKKVKTKKNLKQIRNIAWFFKTRYDNFIFFQKNVRLISIQLDHLKVYLRKLSNRQIYWTIESRNLRNCTKKSSGSRIGKGKGKVKCRELRLKSGQAFCKWIFLHTQIKNDFSQKSQQFFKISKKTTVIKRFCVPR